VRYAVCGVFDRASGPRYLGFFGKSKVSDCRKPLECDGKVELAYIPAYLLSDWSSMANQMERASI
jgi:hypothetical protein